ncbi:PssE/Cps14G family polysaccharide biosynthesis glycosyltransferase [Metabacillus sp. 84]|uniref:PssE/Cps14G family polysaccharide biosynthesis glycosyltransferase n=1 Tax=Metabacillus sp. 84 TaxID=3404705 RepID=UPI003CE833DF
MIFVTVGTHEQQFDRLVKSVDDYVGINNINKTDVFIQTGYTNYKPKNTLYEDMLSYERMNQLYMDSDIIITHGGPGSMFLPWKYGKKVIAVPRLAKFGEHVDNHQLDFCRIMEQEEKVICVEDINNLNGILNNVIYSNDKEDEIERYVPKTNEFIRKFSIEINNIM